MMGISRSNLTIAVLNVNQCATMHCGKGKLHMWYRKLGVGPGFAYH